MTETCSWNPGALGTGTHTGLTWLEPHLLLCLVCKGRRRGLVQESHLISGRNKTSAYLTQLCSSCKGWRGEGHGKGPRGPHTCGHVAATSFLWVTGKHRGSNNWETWRAVFCIVHKIHKLQLGPVLGSPWEQWTGTRKFTHPVNPLGIQRSRQPGKSENFLQQLQQLLRQKPLKLH